MEIFAQTSQKTLTEQLDNLILYKLIFAKRKKHGKNWVTDVLNLEIETHLRYNPALGFIKVGDVVENNDGSKSFQLIFGVKEFPIKGIY